MYERPIANNIAEVIQKLYDYPIPNLPGGIKRALIKCDFKYVKELEGLGAVRRIPNADRDGVWSMQLEPLGFDIIEKYGGWDEYEKQVINRKRKVEGYEYNQKKYWWIPLAISIMSLGIAIAAYLNSI